MGFGPFLVGIWGFRGRFVRFVGATLAVALPVCRRKKRVSMRGGVGFWATTRVAPPGGYVGRDALRLYVVVARAGAHCGTSGRSKTHRNGCVRAERNIIKKAGAQNVAKKPAGPGGGATLRGVCVGRDVMY
jgi:hypothetical protein